VRRILRVLLPVALRRRLWLAYEWAEPFLYAGWRVQCPCCGSRWRRFLPHGRPRRTDARCGRCGALERHRLLMLIVRRRTRLFSEPLSLLHFAPEEALQSVFRRLRNLFYVTADLNMPRVLLHTDIMRLALASNRFDCILCSHVLEHVSDDSAALAELLRVLRPGGWAIIHVPVDPGRSTTYENAAIVSPEERFLHFGQEDHVRMYGRDFGERLHRAGFIVTADDYVRKLTREAVIRYGLPDEEIYFCRKPGHGGAEARMAS
jgi:SAM-dependent methyltransferase